MILGKLAERQGRKAMGLRAVKLTIARLRLKTSLYPVIVLFFYDKP